MCRDERVNLCGSLYLFQAYVQLIEHFGWKSYTILYEDNQGLVQYQGRNLLFMNFTILDKNLEEKGLL